MFNLFNVRKNNPTLILKTKYLTPIFKIYGLDNINVLDDFTKGCDQRVYLVNCHDQQYIYKEPIREPVKLSNEIYGCNIAKQVNVPAPIVLYHSDSYLIETVIEGKDLSQIPDKPIAIYKQLGQYLKKIHQIPVNYFGEREKSEHSTGKELINSYHPSDLAELLSRKIFTPDDMEKIQLYFSQREKYLAHCTPCLIHQDISDNNVMSNGKIITGIIDWADLGGGYPEQDFCGIYIEHWSDSYYNALVEGYGGINQDKVEYFTAIRLTWMINGKFEEKNFNNLEKYLSLFCKILAVKLPNLVNVYQDSSLFSLV